MPLGRLCNFVQHQLTLNADERGLSRFKSQLWMPPRGQAPDPRSPWSAENESSAFAALTAGLGIVPNSGAEKTAT